MLCAHHVCSAPVPLAVATLQKWPRYCISLICSMRDCKLGHSTCEPPCACTLGHHVAAHRHTCAQSEDCGSNDLCCLQSCLQRCGFTPEVCLLCCARVPGAAEETSSLTETEAESKRQEGTEQWGGRTQSHRCTSALRTSAGAPELCPLLVPRGLSIFK